MSGSFALDTNVVIAILNQESALESRLEEAEIFIPAIVIGELYFGAYKSNRVARNLERLNRFLADHPTLACDVETAQLYGQIKNRLREKGRPLPENDIWIAALAQQHDLTLATRDEHFHHVGRLKTEAW